MVLAAPSTELCAVTKHIRSKIQICHSALIGLVKEFDGHMSPAMRGCSDAMLLSYRLYHNIAVQNNDKYYLLYKSK